MTTMVFSSQNQIFPEHWYIVTLYALSSDSPAKSFRLLCMVCLRIIFIVPQTQKNCKGNTAQSLCVRCVVRFFGRLPRAIWRKICTQIACKAVRRALCGVVQEKIYRRTPAVSGKNRLLSMCIFPTVYSNIAIAVQIAADCIVINRIFFMRSLHILTGISGSSLLRSARTMPNLRRHKFFCLHIIIHNNCQNYNAFLCIVIKL